LDNLKPIHSTDIGRLCREFINLQRSVGYKYDTEERVLRYFTRYCEQCYPNADLPVDIINQWIISNPNQSQKSKGNKSSILKRLAQYAFSLGYEPLRIPLVRYTRNTSHIPHIFTNDEMNAIWETSDNIKYSRRYPHLARTIPVLFRLLYASGLRISEAINLNGEDVDFSSNIITIRQSKFDRERLIPMSKSLAAVMKKYADECVPAIEKTEPFFYYQRGVRLTQHSVYGRFRMTLSDSGIPYKGPKKGPRLHDLRHTFAVNAMNKLADEGKDLYVVLPVLSAYLGHSSIKSTERYVRLTQDRLASITEKVCDAIPNIFPEVEADAEI
jgi:integrase